MRNEQAASRDQATIAEPAFAVDLAGPVPRQITLMYQGDYEGFLRPCQCSQKQSGGWPRTGSLLTALRSVLAGQPLPAGMPELVAPDEGFVSDYERFLGTPPQSSDGEEDRYRWPPALVETPHSLAFCDLGGFSRMLTAYPVLRSQYELRLMAQAGIAACVPGSTELEFTADQAAEVFKDCPVPLVSCNLHPGEVDLPLVPAIALAPGWYLIGVTSNLPSFPAAPEDPWFELLDAVESVRAARAALPEEAQVIVAANHQPRKVIEALAALDVDAVIGLDTSQLTDWPHGLAPVFSPPAPKGITQAMLSFDSSQPELQAAEWRIELDEEWPDDSEMVALIKAENEESRELLKAGVSATGQEGWKTTDWTTTDRFLPPEFRAGAKDAPKYLGAEACLTCHPDAYDVWQASRHSHAMQSLAELGEQQTLDCLECHTTGMYELGGFDALKPLDALASISCEECHGPGSKHVEAMSSGSTEDTQLERMDLAACLRCHDPYNSPGFEPNTYWSQIEH